VSAMRSQSAPSISRAIAEDEIDLFRLGQAQPDPDGEQVSERHDLLAAVLHERDHVDAGPHGPW